MSTLPQDPVKVKQVLRVRELFHGRYSESEIIKLLDTHEWDEAITSDFILTSEPKIVRQAIQNITSKGEEDIQQIQSDQNIVEEVKNNLVPTQTRQFACEDCDRMWWRRVPSRKQVSECRKCFKKYDPVPREKEWGWAIFDCECGNSFSGWGQMDSTYSDCRQCGLAVSPSEIRPPYRRRNRRSRQWHSCDAPDCGSQDDHPHFSGNVCTDGAAAPPGNLETVYDIRQPSLNIQNPDLGRQDHGGYVPTSRYDRGYTQKTCVSPQSRQGKKKVIYPSSKHRSTGSTVRTFLSQDDIESLSSYTPSLPSVRE